MSEINTATEKKIKLVINRIHNLPTPPMVFTQINKVLNNPNTSAYQIGAIISEDPALTAKVLKLTNSAFYSLPRTVTSVKQAIIILGLDVVRSLVLSASVFETFSKQYNLDKEFLDNFWRHSLSVAFMARIISRTKSFPSFLEAEESFSAGLLHDIGKVIIFSHLPDEFTQIKQIVADNPETSWQDVETGVLGFDHAMVGSHLAQKWNLPEDLCDAIRHHHDPESSRNDSFSTHLIHLSDYLSKKLELDESNKEIMDKLQSCPASWEKLEIDQKQEEELLMLLSTEYIKAETFLNMARGD